jgi:hypothetical protein
VLSAFIRVALICALFLVALASGYGLSSSLGQGAVRREAEAQLGKLMRGRVTIERTDVRIRRGLWIEGQGVKVYPSASGPGLAGRHVRVRIDVMALVTGRFRVLDLEIDGLEFEIERNEADRWNPYPIDAIDRRGEARDPDDLERKLGALRVIDGITRTLLAAPFIAQRIEVKDSRVRLVDRFVRERGAPPFEVEISQIEGQLVHDWLGDTAKLELRGELRDEFESRVPIEAFGERREDGAMQLSLAFTRLDLAAYRYYFQDQAEGARRDRDAGDLDPEARPFAGLVSGVVHFESPEPEHGVLELDWAADDLHMAIPRANHHLDLASPHLALNTRIEFHPGRIRLGRLDLTGPDVRIDVSGDIERPLRGSSPARFEVFFRDVGLDAIDRIVSALPAAEREPLLHTLTRIEAGRIVRLGGSGTERFSVWQDVLRGERLDLPPGLAMVAEVDHVTLQLGRYERLTDLSGNARWTRDRIEITRARGQRSGHPTPQLNLTLEGFPALFDEPRTFDPDRITNTSLPGIALLGKILAANPEAGDVRAEDEEPVPVEIEIEVDHLEHSGLLWPLYNAKLEAVLLPDSQSFHVAHGRWGGAELEGDVQLSFEEETTVDAHLRVWKPEAASVSRTNREAPAADAPPEAPEPPPSARDADRVVTWAAGRFFVDGLHGKHWPVGPTVTHFTLDGDALSLRELRGRLVPRGRLEAGVQLDLSNAESVGFATQFEIRDADAGRVLSAIGFPDDFATGTLQLGGQLEGPVFPGRNPFELVEGHVEFKARHGEIRQSIPLAAALAHVAEGLSPARANDALLYETATTRIEFDRGTLSSDEIKIDGPLRIFLSGRFDFAKPQREIDAEIGIFLFRQVDRLLGRLPLLDNLIPGGRDRGLFGAFFDVSGTLDEPVLDAMPMKSLTDGVPLPDLVKAPFSAIREAFQGDDPTPPNGRKREADREPES